MHLVLTEGWLSGQSDTKCSGPFSCTDCSEKHHRVGGFHDRQAHAIGSDSGREHANETGNKAADEEYRASRRLSFPCRIKGCNATATTAWNRDQHEESARRKSTDFSLPN